MVAVQIDKAESIERLPFEKYIALDGIHATALKDMRTSPLLYKWRRDHPREDKDAFRVGRACHTAILEPDRFGLEYVVWRSEKMGRRFGKKWDEFQAVAVASGMTVLTEAQYDTALALRDSARAHSVARRYLLEPGKNELTIRWRHPRTGMGCVSRIDRLCGVLLDLKTARDPSPARFCSDSAKYGYAMQMAFYADAVASLGVCPPVKLLVCQSVEPYDIAVYDVPEDVLTLGRKQYEEALDRVAACTRSGVWPGIAPDEEIPLHLPAWAVPEEEPILFGDQAI